MKQRFLPRILPRLLPLLFSTIASAAVAGPESLKTCMEDPQPVIKWAPTGADTVACHQMVFGAGIDGDLAAGDGEKMAAFRKNVLLAIRPGDAANPPSVDAPVYGPGEWLETGSTGVPGELWWGRTATRHVFTGQEAHVRHGKAQAHIAPSLHPALRDFTMRRMMSVVQKRPMATKPGDERFKLFPRKTIQYAQLGATMATFDGGYGGDGLIPPGKVSNARLELVTEPVIRGVLKFDLSVDGETRQFTIPLRAPSEQEHLRATAADSDNAPFCTGVRIALSEGTRTECVISSTIHSTQLFDGRGAFFGDRASLVAIHFRMILDSPPRHRRAAAAIGAIVLKAQ